MAQETNVQSSGQVIKTRYECAKSGSNIRCANLGSTYEDEDVQNKGQYMKIKMCKTRVITRPNGRAKHLEDHMLYQGMQVGEKSHM